MEGYDREYTISYPATIVVRVRAESQGSAKDYAHEDVIRLLVSGNLKDQGIYFGSRDIISATIALGADGPTVQAERM